MNPKDFPLRVKSSFSGSFEALLWYSYDEGQHMLIGKDQAQVEKLWKSVLTADGDREPKEYWRGHTVQPPKKLQEAAVKQNIWNAFHSFKSSVHSDLTILSEAGLIPADWKECIKCRGNGHGKSYGECRKCQYIGYQFKNLTPRQAFEHLYDPNDPGKFNFQQKIDGFLPKGPEAVHGEILYSAIGNFGHHSGGVSIEEVSLNNFIQNPLMLFAGERLPIPEYFTSLKKQQILAFEAEQASRVKRDETERNLNTAAYINKILSRYSS